MNRLQSKHWLLIAAFLASTAGMLAGMEHWGEVLKPGVIAGLLGQLAVQIGSLYAGAPENPNLDAATNPGRRADDPSGK
jgi:hypothetical protein